MRELSRALIWAALVVAIALAADRAAGVFFDRLLDSSGHRFSRLYRGAMEHEILTIGNSRGVNAFPSKAISETSGLSAFNLSYNGMSARVSEAFVMDYLERNSSPELVVIEISNIEMGDDLLPELRPYAHRSRRIWTMIEDSSSGTARGMRVSRLFSYNSELFLRVLYYLRHDDQGWANSRVISAKALKAEDERKYEPEAIAPEPEQLRALGRLVRRLRSDGIEVRLVLGPYLPAYRARMTGLDSLINAVESESGIKVYDFSEAIQDASMFADRLHLNTKGAAKLIEIMKDCGVFDAGSSVRQGCGGASAGPEIDN